MFIVVLLCFAFWVMRDAFSSSALVLAMHPALVVLCTCSALEVAVNLVLVVL